MTHSGDCCRWYSRNSSWAVDRVASNSFISWSFSFSCCLKTVAWFCKLAVSYYFSYSFPWKVIICWVTPLSCSFLSCIFPRRFVSCCSVSANCFLKVSSSSFFFLSCSYTLVSLNSFSRTSACKCVTCSFSSLTSLWSFPSCSSFSVSRRSVHKMRNLQFIVKFRHCAWPEVENLFLFTSWTLVRPWSEHVLKWENVTVIDSAWRRFAITWHRYSWILKFLV